MKIGKRLVSIVLCLVLVLGLLPTVAMAEQPKISEVEATSPDLDGIPKLYGLLKIPEFTVTKGDPAYIMASDANLRWQKYDNGVWTNQEAGRFTPGEWRISTSLRLDDEGALQYDFAENLTFTVDGDSWGVESPNNHGEFSLAWVYSPSFTINDDPNVQPPVPVESVHMVLNGYAPGAAAASATVTTDANVDVQVLGFLKFIDSNGDGTPDAPEEFTGNFASGEMYVVVLKIKAKPGYDISGLTMQKVSLDRADVHMFAGFDMNEECFSVMYILGDAMQYTVTFETNGGSEIQPVSVGGGGFVAEPTAPTRAYYDFDSWYSDEELTTPFSFANTPITEDTTLYAKWTPSPVNGKFLMTIDLNGGTFVTPQPLTAECPDGATMYFTDDISGHVTPPSGKVLAGYEVNGAPYDPAVGHTVTENFTLKFLWKDAPVTTYTVSFDANGGTGTMADVTGISGEYTLPENGFAAPEGKRFKAWSVGGSEKAVGDKITVTADTVVTAVWEDIPAGHTCDIKPVAKVEPSCTESGKEAYYKCNGCGKAFEDALGKKEITNLFTWGNIPKISHTDMNKDNKCDDCGGGIVPSRPNNPVNPTIPGPAPDSGSDKLVQSAETFDGGIALYVGMTILAATGSAWLAKKKD